VCSDWHPRFLADVRAEHSPGPVGHRGQMLCGQQQRSLDRRDHARQHMLTRGEFPDE
jgi:hypothetical protein